jgi:phage replication-related protein YjqB (UPF0714/DUF867 family)
MAIHGGGLEQMTDVIAERAADAAGASVYLLRHPADYPHHLPSALYRPEDSDRLAEFLDHVEGRDLGARLRTAGPQQPTAGGRAQPDPRGSRRRALRTCRATGSSPTSTRSRASCAACTRTTRSTVSGGGGTQLELSPRLRGTSPRSAPPEEDGLSPPTSALIQGLVAAARSWEMSAI